MWLLQRRDVDDITASLIFMLCRMSNQALYNAPGNLKSPETHIVESLARIPQSGEIKVVTNKMLTRYGTRCELICKLKEPQNGFLIGSFRGPTSSTTVQQYIQIDESVHSALRSPNLDDARLRA